MSLQSIISFLYCVAGKGRSITSFGMINLKIASQIFKSVNHLWCFQYGHKIGVKPSFSLYLQMILFYFHTTNVCSLPLVRHKPIGAHIDVNCKMSKTRLQFHASFKSNILSAFTLLGKIICYFDFKLKI